jgi:two-component system, chemotaxis family, CheB/CheR fusion protein
MGEGEKPFPEFNDLVVVGSSAGGIEALSVLVSSLPSDFPAPVVLAQHLDPTRPSNLNHILERRSTLPVVLVEDRARVEAGVIYVVPSNRHVTIRNGQVELEGDHGDRPRPSVDVLFSSAAKSYGERLIAVILTGSGSDGASGAVDVKKAGGIVIIQNPDTARYPSMPMALPPTAVDHVADLERIGPMLHDLCKGVELPKPREKAEDALRELLLQVNRHSNIDFRQYKPSTLMRRISRRMVVTRNANLRDYAKYLEEHPEEASELAMTFLIKVTEFFRDQQAFDYLKEHILTRLIEQARMGDRTLRIWSAGCATGEEPYSLAMLVADLLGAELPQWRIKIFATDLDKNAISFARRGLYPDNVLDNLPDDYRDRFFEQAENGCRVAKTLRQMIIFGQQDLSRGVPFPRIDLVVCRNLLIYFNADLQQRVLDLFAFSLHNTGGYLFLGKAETVRPSKNHYQQVDKRLKVYQCVSNPRPVKDERGLYGVPRSWLNLQGYESRAHKERRVKAAEPDAPRQAHLARQEVASEIGLAELRRFNELVFRFLPAGVVIIDRHYHILTANGAARRLLAFRDMANDQDFLHSVRGLPYAEARAAIDTVFRERTTESLPELAVEAFKSGEERYLNFRVAPLQIESGAPDFAVITVEDVTEQIRTRRRLEAAQVEQKELVDELSAANAKLNDLNKELLDTNEQLQATNEEMMLTQEELQATNEELEATNEEAQATNEELETNNEELQATNEELETTNEELIVRTNELQETAKSLADERVRLTEIIELAPFDVMILRGPGLVVEAANARLGWLPRAREITGHPVADIFHDPEMAELVSVIREAHRLDQVGRATYIYHQAPEKGGEPVERCCDYTIVPTHNSAGEVSGVVIYAEDVTVRHAREMEEKQERLHLFDAHAKQVKMREELERLDYLKDQFFSLASHELRTPLVPLMGYSEALIRLASQPGGQPDRDQRIAQMAGKFHQQIKLLARLTDDLLDMARLQSGKLSLQERPVDLARLIEKAIEEARLISPRHTIRFEKEDQPLIVRGDEDRLAQALNNILNNAIKHAPLCDRIDVRLSHMDEGGRVPVGANQARIEVRDYGPGIPPENLESVFNRFFQISEDGRHHRSGLGLGLFIARGIIKQHDGAITAESKPGEGSAFIIRLPLMSK